MKRGGTKFIWRRSFITALLAIACGIFAPSHCHAQEVALLLNQTPLKAGEISPVAGVHHFKSGSQVTLTANPKPGYQFLHWLGDVSDSSSRSTMVYLNEPKVVVAVFEAAKYSDKNIMPGGGGGGGGGLMPTATNFYPKGGISAGGGGGGKPGPIIYTNQKTPEVPEPATGVLLVMGSLFAFSRRRARKQISRSTEVKS